MISIGKEDFQNIWIVLDNEDWEKEICPCCGAELKEKQKQYSYVEGFFNKISYDADDMYFWAEYYDEVKRININTVVGRLYVGYEAFTNKNPRVLEDLANFSIFDDHWWSDCGDSLAFRTEEEAKAYCDEFNAYNE